jgi:hypothetical protein
MANHSSRSRGGESGVTPPPTHHLVSLYIDMKSVPEYKEKIGGGGGIFSL